MLDKIGAIVVATFLLTQGYSVIKTGSCYVIYGAYFNFGELKNIAGISFIAVGLLVLGHGVHGIVKKTKTEPPSFTICPVCKEPFSRDETPDLKCQKCGHELENLEGFYQRHTEN